MRRSGSGANLGAPLTGHGLLYNDQTVLARVSWKGSFVIEPELTSFVTTGQRSTAAGTRDSRVGRGARSSGEAQGVSARQGGDVSVVPYYCCYTYMHY